jgi:hypothetical protein
VAPLLTATWGGERTAGIGGDRMKEGRASRTAEYMALFRALEAVRLPCAAVSSKTDSPRLFSPLDFASWSVYPECPWSAN